MLDSAARESWDVLTRKLGAFIGRRLPAEDVDDVVQNVLVRIYQGTRDLNDESRFGPWVYAIARNAVIDHLRKKPQTAGESVTTAEPAIETDAERDTGLSECVAPFVARLAEPYRQAITLVELRGLTQSDAAEIAGVSLSGMKSRVQRGRHQLRLMFEECCELSIDRRGRVFDAERREGSAAGAAQEPCGAANCTAVHDLTRAGRRN